MTSDQLLVAQLDQNSLYATQFNNAYLAAQTLHAQSQQPQSQWISENSEHLTSDNSSGHLLDNQIIVTTLKSSPKHCTVNCCDYGYQFSSNVFNSAAANTTQSNYMTTNQTNLQTTNGQSQYVSAQHYLVSKNSDLQETLT